MRNCDEGPSAITEKSANAMNAVWILIAFDLVLTLLTGYALWAKAEGLQPFSGDPECQLFP